MEGCLLKRLWIRATMTNAPEGGTASDSRLSFLQNEAAKYAGKSGDFKHESRSCKWHSAISVHKHNNYIYHIATYWKKYFHPRQSQINWQVNHVVLTPSLYWSEINSFFNEQHTKYHISQITLFCLIRSVQYAYSSRETNDGTTMDFMNLNSLPKLQKWQ